VVRLLIVAGVVVVAVVVALVSQRRRPDAPANPIDHEAPAQLDRADFDRPEAPWLVAVFSSETCGTCGSVWERVAPLESASVATMEVEVGERRDLHDRYHVTAVPTTVVADRDGVVVRSFIGPVTATHLWGALAEVREPGSVPDGCSGAEPIGLGGAEGQTGEDEPPSSR
jgi:hypothetical protein